MRVLVIPEDFTLDQHILKPIIQALFAKLGKPRTKVVVCQDPRLGGVDQATSWERLREIIDRYRMVDLFVLCVDRDGNEGRKQVLDNLEVQATTFLANPAKLFVAENAHQEIEVWAVAGHNVPREWNWEEVRTELHPKERYFVAIAEQENLANDRERMYAVLGKMAANRYGRICQLCPEVQQLEDRISNWMMKD